MVASSPYVPRTATRIAGALVILALSACRERAAPPTRPPPANPLATLAAEEPSARPIAGRVVQRLKVSSYTYLEIESADGARVWVAMLGAGPEEGARVRVRSMGRRKNFDSPRLGRTFPELVFGIVSRES